MPRPTPVAVTVAALVFATPAWAHVTVVPPFIPAESRTTLSLSGPNERDEPMTGFEITVTNDFRIVQARSADGWDARVLGTTAIWTEGSLAPGAEATFSLELEAPSEPGPAQLEVAQRYPGGDIVTWDVALNVTPGSEPSSQNLGWALVTAVIGIGVIVAVGVVLLRRAGSLQEK
jgi:uncharacterized protein YcnI